MEVRRIRAWVDGSILKGTLAALGVLCVGFGIGEVIWRIFAIDGTIISRTIGTFG